MAYTDKKYWDRQCIIVVNDDRGMGNDEIDVFNRINLPSDIIFSEGRASLNKIYIAHPAKKGLYIPLADHDLTIFRDKMDELIILLQAIGATDIEILRTKGLNTEQMNRKATSIEAGGSWKCVSGSMGMSKNQSNYNANSRAESYHIKIKSYSDRYPFVPKELHWYQITPAWEKMVKQRMLGLEEYELELKSSYSSSISSSRMESLKIAAKIIFAKLNFATSSEYESNFKESGEIVWGLKIKFRPLKEYSMSNVSFNANNGQYILKDISTQSLSSENQGVSEYKESCKLLIPKNGKISDTIRIELNRLRENLGISASKAIEIEAEFTKNKKWFWPF